MIGFLPQPKSLTKPSEWSLESLVLQPRFVIHPDQVRWNLIFFWDNKKGWNFDGDLSGGNGFEMGGNYIVNSWLIHDIKTLGIAENGSLDFLRAFFEQLKSVWNSCFFMCLCCACVCWIHSLFLSNVFGSQFHLWNSYISSNWEPPGTK